jgi:transposase-like protein
MSTKKKTASKAVSTGVRYPEELKKQVIEFVEKHNSEKGRGGQSAASSKFKITPLTIATWLKAAGVKSSASKTAKKAAEKAPKKAVKKAAKKATKKAAKKAGKKAVKKAAGKATKTGVRYPSDFKKQVVDFVTQYNDTKGRGGQNQAAKKFKLSVLTVSAWLKAAGVKNPSRKPLAKKASTLKKAAGKSAKKAGRAVLSELEALKAAIRKLID